MSSEDVRRTLEALIESFSLGSYEIEAYLAVLETGELTASEIAETTDVPQPRVYDTVRSLSDRGLVELQESRPMNVVARDPEVAFTGFRSSLGELVSALENRYQSPARGTETVSVLSSVAAIEQQFEAVIDSTEYELTISLTPALFDTLESQLVEASERGVSTELLLTPAGDAPTPEAFEYAQLTRSARARRGRTTPLLAVADGEYAIFTTQEAIGTGTGGPDRYGVVFRNSTLGFLVLGFFKTVLWTTAERLHAPNRTGERLPRRYASIRRAIGDIRALDQDVYATVRGRDIMTGEHRVCRGKVTATHATEDEAIAAFRLQTAEGDLEIGGQVAAYEDIEAHEIRIDSESPPSVDRSE